MKTTFRWPVLALSALSLSVLTGLLAACASDDDSAHDPSEDAAAALPSSDAGLGDGEAGADADAAPCTDCDDFPEACTADTLCPGAPFNPTNPNEGMDWRTRINMIRGRSASDVWLVGALGTVAHFDGTSWTTSDLGTRDSQRMLWLPSSGEVSFGSLQKVFTRGLDLGGGADAGVSSGGWSLYGAPSAPTGSNTAVTATWSLPASDVLWLATTVDLWRLRLTPASTFESVAGVPSSVCSAIPCKNLRSIHGSSAGTLWGVGDIGAAVRITGADGDSPVTTSFDTATWTGLTGVWAAADDDVWAVGGAGTIRHYDKTRQRWNIVPDVPTSTGLNAVWGTSATDIWAVGNESVVLHYDGTAWTRIPVAGLGARRPGLYTIWSPAAGHVWIGGDGVVLSLGGKP